MPGTIKKITKIIFPFLFLVSFGLFYLYEKIGEQHKNNSLIILVDDILGVKYQIIAKNAGSSGPDLSGYWWIKTDNNQINYRALTRQFHLADHEDLTYYMKVFQNKLTITKPLSGYELYRADMVLGENTICENFSCNIEILINKNDQDVFIGISNN